MKKALLAIVAVAVIALGSSVPAAAWVFVPTYEDTGWQTYTYTAGANGFQGTAGFVVSDQGDTVLSSKLLLDNLSQADGATTNAGFELGNYTDYTLGPSSDGTVVGTATAYDGTVYSPTEGTLMSLQVAQSDGTSSFFNAYGNPGTDGSILETAIALLEGGSFSFNWAFLAFDYTPFEDFSLFYLKDETGAIVYTYGLGQLGPGNVIPEPSTILLLGAGLVGLGLWARRKVI